jgi:PAS domain S-box-containing protein
MQPIAAHTAVLPDLGKLRKYQRFFFTLLSIIIVGRVLVYFISDPLLSIIARNFFNEARSIAAAFACYVAARLTRTIAPGLSRAWYIMSISFWGWIIGILLHFFTELQGRSVVGTFVDLPYLMFYPIFLFGVLQLPMRQRTRDDRIALSFDLAIVLVAAFLVVWVLAIRHQLTNTSRFIEVISAIAYAFGDMLLIWGAFYILVGLSSTLRLSVRMTLALGAMLLFATDLIYSWQVRQGNYDTTNLVGFGWTLGLATFAVAGTLAWVPWGAHSSRPAASAGWLQLSGAVSIVLSTVCLAISLVIAWALQDPLSDKVTILLIAILFLLVIGRQIAGAHILARLRTLLLDANALLEKRVTERTRQLSMERDRSEAILASVQDAIIIHDLDGRLLDVNPAMLAMFGLTRPQITLLTMDDISSPANPLGQIHETWRSMTLGNSQRFDWQAQRANGEAFPVDIMLTRFELHAQPALVASVRDMSTHRHLQEQLLRSQRLEAIGKLAGGMAHDFNNLLVPILGYSELLLLKMPEDSPERESVSEIAKAAERARELTRQLLSFGRKSILETTVFNLNTLIVGFEKMLRRLVREDIEFAFILAADLGNISGDRFQIEQALMNLVVNARDAMPSGGTITVRTFNSQAGPENLFSEGQPIRQVVLQVRDGGIGMPPEIQARLFEPFFTTKEVGHGTGLGLATVFGIIRRHSGTIHVDSTPNVGSTFTIRLPRVEQDITTSPAVSTKSMQGAGRILVVEDNEGVRIFVTQALCHHGYEVVAMQSPLPALQLLAEPLEKVDALLSDVIMPEMNGYAFIERARKLRPGLPVLLMTGYADDVLSAMQIKDHSIPSLQKPFSAHDLASKIVEISCT